MKDNTLSSKEWELISAYLDNELNAQDKARVEERIKNRPEYKEAIEGLQRTKAILHKASVRKVPRNFTLKAADVQQARIPRWIPAMQWSSVVAALTAVFLYVFQLSPGLAGLQQKAPSNLGAASPTQSAMEMAAPETMAAAEAAPGIIYWGGAPAPSGGYGMGGGSGCGEPGAMCGGGAADGIGGGAGVDAPVTQNPFPQPPIPNSLPDLQVGSTAKIAIAPTEPVTGTGPVLGVRPADEQGDVLSENRVAVPAVSVPPRQAEPAPTFAWAYILTGGLLVLALGLFIAGVMLRRKISR